MSARRLSHSRKITTATVRNRKPIAAGERLLDVPPPPAELTPAAAAEWRVLAATLIELGTLRAADLRALALLCQTLAFADELAAVLQREGVTVAGANGTTKGHPAAQALATARAQAHRLLADFGLLPRARAGVDPAPDALPAESPAAEFFR